MKLSGRDDGENMMQAHRFITNVKTLFENPNNGDDKRKLIMDYAVQFRFAGCKIYSLAWKGQHQKSELIRDYLATRVANSEFLKHVTNKKLPIFSHIFDVIKPHKSYDLDGIKRLCEEGQVLESSRGVSFWTAQQLRSQANRLQHLLTGQAAAQVKPPEN